MSTGLDASTVTPGSTAPDVSLTVPAMPLAVCCAHATDGSSIDTRTMTDFTPTAMRENRARIRSTSAVKGPRSVVAGSNRARSSAPGRSRWVRLAGGRSRRALTGPTDAIIAAIVLSIARPFVEEYESVREIRQTDYTPAIDTQSKP